METVNDLELWEKIQETKKRSQAIKEKVKKDIVNIEYYKHLYTEKEFEKVKYINSLFKEEKDLLIELEEIQSLNKEYISTMEKYTRILIINEIERFLLIVRKNIQAFFMDSLMRGEYNLFKNYHVKNYKFTKINNIF